MFKISQDKLERLAEKVAEEMQERAVQRRNFTIERQDGVVQSISHYLKQNHHIDSDELYDKEVQSLAIDPQDFHFLFDNIMDAAEALNRIGEDEGNPFANKLCYLNYYGERIIFFIMWGQGTCTQIYIREDEWKDQYSITYEEVKALQAKQGSMEKESYSSLCGDKEHALRYISETINGKINTQSPMRE
jgi:hypothetical protein